MYRKLCIVALFAFSAPSFFIHEAEAVSSEENTCHTAHGIEGFPSIQAEDALKDPTTRCYEACVLTENGVLKPDGTINVDVVDKFVPRNTPDRALVVKAFHDCANEHDQNSCDTAYKSLTCVLNQEAIAKISKAFNNYLSQWGPYVFHRH